MNQVTNFLEQHNLTTLGPTLAPIEKINNLYRFHLIIKSTKAFQFQDLYLNNRKLDQFLSKLRGVRYQFDIDPLSLL